jgi:hypothetical protein
LCFAQLAHSTDSADTTTDPELIQAQLKQKLAEAKQATAEAELAAAKAKIGEISVALPKGTTTSTTQHIEGTILAYQAAASAVASIVKDVTTAPAPKQVVLFSQKEISALTVYQSFKVQADLLITRIPALTTKPTLVSDSMPVDCVAPVKPKVAPLLVVDTALQLLGLFKVDRTITGSDVALDEFGVYSLIASDLVAKGISVAYPPSYFPNALNPTPTPLAIHQTFQTLSQKHIELGQFVNQLNDTKNKLSAGKEKATAKCKGIYDADIDTVNVAVTQATAAQAAIGQVITALTAADSQSGVTLIQTLSSAELLATGFKSASVLQVKPIAAGGNVQTATNIFRTKLSFSGGVVLSYMLFDPTGAVAHAGTVPLYGGYVDASEMK